MNIPNIHPVDELAAVREEIKLLQDRADEIRDGLLAEGADLIGNQYRAEIKPQSRETLDRKALEETYGTAAIAPFIKTTHYHIVKTVDLTVMEALRHAKA